MWSWRRAWGRVGLGICEYFCVVCEDGDGGLMFDRSRIMKGLMVDGEEENLDKLIEGIEQLQLWVGGGTQ